MSYLLDILWVFPGDYLCVGKGRRRRSGELRTT